MEWLYKLHEGNAIYNQQLLEDVCKQIGKRPVAIISTGGKSRFGKTFWQNILLKGLRSGDTKFEAQELIGGAGGIPFRKGFSRDTVGITIWPEVFTCIDVNGDEIAVILMDTQGTFDNQSEVDDSINYFSTSLLLSSIQVFNVNSKVDATDFESLASFIEFSQASGEKVGQHFIFLIRDALAGEGLCEDFLDNMLTRAMNSPQLYQLIFGCINAFEKIDTYLVVPPENAVRSADGQIEAGRCGEEFLALLCGAAKHVLDSLRPKVVIGEVLNGETYLQYAKGVFQEMHSKSRFQIGNFYSSLKQLSVDTAKRTGMDKFRELWNKEEVFDILKPEEFEAGAMKILQESIQAYENTQRRGNEKELAGDLKLFTEKLSEKTKEKCLLNAEKYKIQHLNGAIYASLQVYDRTVQSDIADLLETETINDVQDSHRKATKAAFNYFNESTAEFCATDYQTVRQNKAQLVEMLEDRLIDALNRNTQQWVRGKAQQLVENQLGQFEDHLKAIAPDAKPEDLKESLQSARKELQNSWQIEKAELIQELMDEQPNMPVEGFERYLDSLYSGTLARGLKAAETQFRKMVESSKTVRELQADAEKRRLEHEKNMQDLDDEIQRLNAQANALKMRETDDEMTSMMLKVEAEHKEQKMLEKMELQQQAEKIFAQDRKLHEERLAALILDQAEQTEDYDMQRQKEAERIAMETAEEQKLQDGLRIYTEAKTARLQKERNNARALVNDIEPAIGIDLGTTYSAVAICIGDEVIMIPNEYGNITTPSQVAYLDDKILVGQAAKNQASRNSGNTIYEVKRLMGKTFEDPTVQANMGLRPYKVVDSFGDPMIEVQYQKKVHTVSPVDVSTQLLTKLREMASDFLGKPVKKAVITVPAYFNNAQREATKEAAERAGLEVLRLLNEPTAAAIAYGIDEKVAERRTVIVYDFGGGTLDISLGQLASNEFKIRATSGNPNLGGEDINNMLLKYCLRDLEGKDIGATTRAWSRLRLACEEAKIQLSTAQVATIEVPSLFLDFDYKKTIAREFYEKICAELFVATLLPIQQALSDANVGFRDVNEVVLVGGSSNIPKVQELLRDKFPEATLWNARPEEMVVRGAAIQAALFLHNCSEDIRRIGLVDVIPLTISIKRWGCGTGVMFNRNTSFPAATTMYSITSSDFQSNMAFQVVEGERSDACLNNSLGRFSMPIRAAKEGEVVVEQCCEIDGNGILTLKAQEQLEGTTRSITIGREKFGKRTVFDISHYMANWQRCNEEDEAFRKSLERLTKLSDDAHALKWLTNPKVRHLTGEKKLKIESIGKEVYNWTQTHCDHPNPAEVIRRGEEMEAKIRQIIG